MRGPRDREIYGHVFPQIRLLSSSAVDAMTVDGGLDAAEDALLVGRRSEAHWLLVISGNLAPQHIAIRVLGHHPNVALVRVARLARKFLHRFHLEHVRTPRPVPGIRWKLLAVLGRLRGRVVVESGLSAIDQ